jgi:hypothetical protein
MSDSDSGYYLNTVPMVRVDDAVEIAELCMLAGKPHEIVLCLNARLTPSEVKRRLMAAAPAASTAEGTTRVAAAAGSLFGGPTPAERDALAAAVKRRFAAMAGKTAT